MALFSIFSKQKSAGNLKAKSSRQSVAPTPSISSAPSSNLLELKLVSPLLLSDATPTLIGDTIPSTPSTPGLVGASPWISVDALEQDEKVRERASLDKEREEKRLGRAVLESGSVIELIQECGGVIRERGLTTLGIFRPYRFAESPNLIRKLCLLFLAYSQDFDNAEGVAQDIWGTRNSKPAKLARFRYELKYAGVHDAVGVLKWGLRHLSPTAPFSSTSGPSSSESSLLWFTDFLAKSASRSYPASSYNAILLPSLPPLSQKLLQEVLPLLESISAHSEVNAMTYRKLSRTLGMYVFGLASTTREWRDWEQLYLTWREAGDVLEGCFKAYLRNQRSLPKRLREIVQIYPGVPVRGRKIRVIRIEVESQGDWRSEEEINDQRTGYQIGGIGGKSGKEGPYEKRGRREPLEILHAAFQASSANPNSDNATRDWELIVEQGNFSGYAKRVLGDETSRVLELVGLDNLPRAASKDERDLLNLNTPTKRSRSISAGGVSSTLSPYSNLTSGSRPQNGTARGKENAGGVSASTKATRRMTPSWSDFASTGFAEKGLLFETSEFGLVKPQPSLQPPSRSNSTRLVRANSRAKSQRVETALDSSYPAGLALTDPSTLDIPSPALPVREEISEIVGIRYYEVDEEFADVWLDTLVDGTAAASWPSFILSAISPSLVQRINALHASTWSEAADHILVIETLIPYKSTNRATSITSKKSFSISSKSRRPWNQRVSGIFTSSNSMRSKMSASQSNASDLTLKAMNSNVPSLPTTPTMKPRPLKSNHYDTFAAIPELPSPTPSPTKPSIAVSPSISSKPILPSPSIFPMATPRSREASASPSAFSNTLRSNNTSSASLTSFNGLASTSAFTPPRPLKNPSRTSLSSIRTIPSDPKMRMENDIPVRSTDSPTTSIFGSRMAEVGNAVVAAGAVSEVVKSDSKREMVSVPAAEERTTKDSDVVPSPAQSNQVDETSPVIKKESVPEIEESSPEVSLSPVASEIKGVVTTERPLEGHSEIHTEPAAALEEQSLPTPEALAIEVPLPEMSASMIKAVAVDELPVEHTEIAASTVHLTSNSSVPLPESLEVKPTDLDSITPAADDKKATTYAPILIAPSPAFLAPVVPSKAASYEEMAVSLPDEVVQEVSEESEIDKVEPGPSAPQDLVEDRDDEDRSNPVTATEVPSQVAPIPAIIDSEAVPSVQAISASSPTSLASPPQSETILSSSPTMSSPGTPRKLSRIPIPSTPTPTKSMLGSPTSPSSLTSPSQTPVTTVDSPQRTLSPAMGSPTTSITPTKKITRVLSGLLRKKSPEEKRFIADSKVEKEKERALRETQKKEKKEEAKIAPEPVSSVRKRVLEIEAEEAAKLESHSRMSSISEGNATLPTGLVAIVPEVFSIQHIEEHEVQEDSKEEILEEKEEKSAMEERTQKQVNRESSATLGLEDPLSSFNARPLSVATVTSGSISSSKLVADDIFSPSHSKIPNSPSTSTITPVGLPKTLSVAHAEGLSDKDIAGLDGHSKREERKDSESGRSGGRDGSFSSDVSSAETAKSFQTAEDLGAHELPLGNIFLEDLPTLGLKARENDIRAAAELLRDLQWQNTNGAAAASIFQQYPQTSSCSLKQQSIPLLIFIRFAAHGHSLPFIVPVPRDSAIKRLTFNFDFELRRAFESFLSPPTNAPMSLHLSPAVVPTPDKTVQAYFALPHQRVTPMYEQPDGIWYQDVTFRGVIQASPSLDLSSSALDFATRASVTASITFELPDSSSPLRSVSLDTSDIPVESIASHVQYIPELADLHLEYYKTSILTEERQSVLSRMTRDSCPQFNRFLYSYQELSEPQRFNTHEWNCAYFVSKVLEAGCKLAEVVDNDMVRGFDGCMTAHLEDTASNKRTYIVSYYQGAVVVVLETRDVRAGEDILRAIEECSPQGRQNIELDSAPSKARDMLRKMALRLDKHKCKLGILSDGASAMIFKLHRPQGAARSIILRSDRFALSSQTSSLIILTANALLSRNDPEIVIEGITDVPTVFLPSLSSFSESQVPRSALSPPSSGTASLATISVDKNQITPLSATSHKERKAAFESEFGIGGVRVVGKGLNQHNLQPYVELETVSGSLVLYGAETKWLKGRELLPIAGKFRSENLLEAQHLTIINNFAVFTPTNLQQLTRITPSHGQLTVSTAPPHTSSSRPVLALSSIISRTSDTMTYASSIEDYPLTVKKVSGRKKVVALQEAYRNTFHLKNLSDIVPEFFGFFTDEGDDYYLIFEYAGECSMFDKLSTSECTILYSRLELLHARGISHGDFGDNKVVVGSGETDRRTIKITAFGYSSMHKCKGEKCSELREARYQLGLSEEI